MESILFSNMIDWNNPWIIGTIPAVISGLIVNYLSKLIWSKRDKRKAQQQISTANDEIVSSLRLSLAEDTLLTREILAALIRATAHKYGLDENLLMSPKLFSDTLIKEVLDSSFLSQSQKAEYSQRIGRQLTSKSQHPPVEVREAKLLDEYYDEYNKSTRKFYVNITSGLAASVVLLFTSFSMMPEMQKNLFLDIIAALWPHILTLLLLAVVMTLTRGWIDEKLHK